MDITALQTEIDSLIATLGDQANIARPELEHGLLDKTRDLLEQTRPLRLTTARVAWETYLPYAAHLCARLVQLEAGWGDELEYFALENAQFWLDCANASLNAGQIEPVKTALARLQESARLVKQDPVFRVDILLQGLDIAIEISDKKQATQLYEDAEKHYRKHVAGSDAYTGSAWLPKIKKMDKALVYYRAKITRYFHYAETVTVAIEADTPADLERLLDYLQQNLVGKVKITKKPTDAEGGKRARVKITLE